MDILLVGIIVGVTLTVFIGIRLCCSCCMRPRYINIDEYDEIEYD